MHFFEVALLAANVAAGVVVVAEALNKLERLDVFGMREDGDAPNAWRSVVNALAPWRWSPGTATRLCQFAVWFACAVGGGGAVMLPLMNREPRTFADVCVLVGFAGVIAHARFVEWRRYRERAVRYEPRSLLE